MRLVPNFTRKGNEGSHFVSLPTWWSALSRKSIRKWHPIETTLATMGSLWLNHSVRLRKFRGADLVANAALLEFGTTKGDSMWTSDLSSDGPRSQSSQEPAPKSLALSAFPSSLCTSISIDKLLI